MSEEEQRRPNVVATNGGLQLIPDPSAATLATLDRRQLEQRSLFSALLHGEVQAITARLNAMDRAVAVFDENLHRVPTETQREVGNLHTLTQQTFATIDQRFNTTGVQFDGIQKQFIERDYRVEQTARDTKIAVDAALQAAEKAVGKSEVATTKQIDALAITLQAASGGLEKQISDLKDRLNRIEGMGMGKTANVIDQRAGVTFAVGVALALVALLEFVLRYAR